MLQVLVHRQPGSGASRSFRCFPSSSIIWFVLLCLLHAVAAQQAAGVVVVDSPAPHSTQHTGSDLGIAVDVSDDGTFSAAAAAPGSSLATRIDSLDIYLVGGDINITVSLGPGLLTQEPSSTVKHLNYPISSCLPAGEYNLTFFETSHINGKESISVTPIPITIENSNGSLSCSGSLPRSSGSTSQPLLSPAVLSSQTGGTSALSSSSFTVNEFPSTISAATSSGTVTVTITPSISVSPPDGTGIVTITLDPSGYPVTFSSTAESRNATNAVTVTKSTTSSSSAQTPGSIGFSNATVASTSSSLPLNTTASSGRITVTVTQLPTPTTVTVVMISQSIQTVTQTPSGFLTSYTTTTAATMTVTAVLNGGNDSGFLPVNGGSLGYFPSSGAVCVAALVLSTYVFVL